MDFGGVALSVESVILRIYSVTPNSDAENRPKERHAHDKRMKIWKIYEKNETRSKCQMRGTRASEI